MKYSVVFRILLVMILAAFLVFIVLTSGKSNDRNSGKPPGDHYGQDRQNIGNIGETVEVFQYTGENKDSQIRAGRMLAFKGGRQIFEDFTFVEFEEESPKVTVKGSKASIGKGDRETSSILAEGKVDIKTHDGVAIKSDYLSYRKNLETSEKILISRGEVEFSKDEISGKGMNLFYNIDKGLLMLHEQVKIKVIPEGRAGEPPVYIAADNMEFDREKHYLNFTGHASIYQKENYLTCQKIKGDLTDDNKKFTRFYASGDLVVFFPLETPSAAENEGPEDKTLFFREAVTKRLSADDLWIDFAEDGVTFKQARLQGHVTFEMIPEDVNKEAKVLKCDEADLSFFAETSQLKQLDARGHVTIAVYSKNQTGPRIEEETREVRCRVLRALFSRETGEIEEIFLEEDLLFTHGDIQSTGKSAYYNLPDDSLMIKGQPKLTDGRNKIMARQIRLDQENHMLIATGHVRALVVPEEKEEEKKQLMNLTDKPVLFLAESMRLNFRTKHVWFEGDVKVSQGDNEIYAGQVELDKRTEGLEARGDVKALFKPSDKDQEQAGAGLLDSGEAVYFWSDSMHIDQSKDEIRFMDNVRVLQGENTITTREMIIFNKEKRFIARGGVKTVYNFINEDKNKTKKENQTILTTARIMAYDENEEKIIYLQDVQVKEDQSRVMGGDQVEIFLSGQKDHIKQIRLKGNVHFRRDAQEGSGEEAEYFPADRRIVLRGKNAKFEEGGRLTSMGNMLTFYFESGKIIADSMEDGRLKTLYSPGQEKNTKDLDADAGD